MRIFRPKLEILPEPQRILWNELASCVKLGFVLYGGTAVSLQIGHRYSVDFDFFSHLSLDESSILNNLPFLQNVVDKEIRVKTNPRTNDNANTYVYITPSHVKFEFHSGITFGRLGEPLITEDGVLQIASLDDLMATKLKTILQRAQKKDYEDIAAMLRCGVSLEKGLGGAAALFGKQFPAISALKALTFFQDGDLYELSKENKNTLHEYVKMARIQNITQIKLIADHLTVESVMLREGS